MIKVSFTIETAPAAGAAEKTFSCVAEMRDFFRTVFFSKAYHVRGADRRITDDSGQLLGFYC